MLSKSPSFTKSLCKQLTLAPVLAASILLFGTKTFSQDTVRVLKIQRAETPSTEEGVSQELLDEYTRIIDKTKNEKGYLGFNKLSDADRNRLQTIYLSMSKNQQKKQVVVFEPPLPPFPKAVPTSQQIEAWKNAKVYGLWIDGKRVSNSKLNGYNNTDFSHMFVSKLSKNAVNYGKHYYQVDLMTTKQYDIYYQQTIEYNKTTKYYMMYRVRAPQTKS